MILVKSRKQICSNSFRSGFQAIFHKGSLARSLALAAFATNPASLEEDHGQRQTGIPTAMALPASHRILQQQKPLNILKAKTRKTKIGGGAFRASH